MNSTKGVIMLNYKQCYKITPILEPTTGDSIFLGYHYLLDGKAFYIKINRAISITINNSIRKNNR